MASDLATALISGNNAGLLADPSLAAITPQLQLAQALTQQGISTAPAYPAQAWGRLAQAIAGVKVAHDAQSDIANLSAGSTGEMAKLFEGTPLADAMRSPSPMVRMLAMQQAGKALLINSENKTMNPGQVQMPQATPRGPGIPVAAGSPAQAGAVEAAKNAPLIARAGGEAAAKSPYEGGGNITVDTPRGRETIPATAATRAAMQPSIGDITLKTPDGPKTMPITAADRDSLSRGVMPERFKAIGATGIWSPGLQAPQQQTSQVPQAPQPPTAAPIVPTKVATQKATPSGGERTGVFGAPGQAATVAERFGPFATMGGEPVKDIPFQTRLEAEKGGVKEFQEKSTPSYEAAQNLKGRLTVMDHNIDALGPKWMGAGANAKGEFGKAWNSLLDSANVKGFHIDPSKIATWEEFNKESTRAGMELIKSNFGGSREAASIIQMGASAVPSAQQTFLGAKYNLSSIRAATQREIDLHEYKSNLLSQGKSLVGADAAFNKEHPAEEYAMAGIVNAIPRPAIEHLRGNPDLASHFDKQFGAGTAEFILGTK